uniref:Uncharacterized protein n=1 Tax=Kalanchoe fedtschenkoi TaxID=63787 RepID=A0A7N0VI82_KALFE
MLFSLADSSLSTSTSEISPGCLSNSPFGLFTSFLLNFLITTAVYIGMKGSTLLYRQCVTELRRASPKQYQLFFALVWPELLLHPSQTTYQQ